MVFVKYCVKRFIEMLVYIRFFCGVFLEFFEVSVLRSFYFRGEFGLEFVGRGLVR